MTPFGPKDVFFQYYPLLNYGFWEVFWMMVPFPFWRMAKVGCLWTQPEVLVQTRHCISFWFHCDLPGDELRKGGEDAIDSIDFQIPWRDILVWAGTHSSLAVNATWLSDTFRNKIIQGFQSQIHYFTSPVFQKVARSGRRDRRVILWGLFPPEAESLDVFQIWRRGEVIKGPMTIMTIQIGASMCWKALNAHLTPIFSKSYRIWWVSLRHDFV